MIFEMAACDLTLSTSSIQHQVEGPRRILLGRDDYRPQERVESALEEKFEISEKYGLVSIICKWKEADIIKCDVGVSARDMTMQKSDPKQKMVAAGDHETPANDTPSLVPDDLAADGYSSNDTKGTQPSACVDGLTVGILRHVDDGTLLFIPDLAREMKVCPTTIKRMIARSELPPSVSLGKGHVWTAGCLRGWINKRLQSAAAEMEIVQSYSQ